MEKVFLRLGSSIGLAVLVLTAALTVAAQAQLPPDPVDIGLPPTPKPIGLPPDPSDIGLPRYPAPMGSSPVPATAELPPAAKSRKPSGAQACEPIRLATVRTETQQDGRIRIPVTVEGRALSFVVDTGGAQTTIKPERAKELGLAPKQTSLTVLGVAGSVMNVFVTSSDFALGELHIKNLPIYVDARNLGEADGTLAPDVMRDYDVDIDLAESSLSLVSQCPGQAADRTGSTVIPLAITGDGHMRFPVKLDGHDIMATLDTGAAMSFMSMSASALLGIDPKAPELRLVRDMGTYQIFTYPFQSLDIGHISGPSPPIAIFSDNFTNGMGSDLVLGVNVLRNMRLTIAYGEKRLYITGAQAN